MFEHVAYIPILMPNNLGRKIPNNLLRKNHEKQKKKEDGKIRDKSVVIQ